MTLENTDQVKGRVMAILEDENGGNITATNPLPMKLTDGTTPAEIDTNGHLQVVDTHDALEIAQGNLSGYSSIHKFGINPDVDAGTEDIWSYGGTMSYLSSAETINIASGDVDDVGTVLSSGTATGGSTTTLIDTGATFVTDTVAVGDIIINDTKKVHGIISAVTETQITVNLPMNRGSQGNSAYTNESGDSYRVVNAGDTGAATLIMFGLDGDYEPILEYIVLNGQNNVATTQAYLRVYRAIILTAGSSGWNEGAVTGTSTPTGTVLFNIRATDGNKTEQAMFTIPNGKTGYLMEWEGSMGGSVNSNSQVQLLAAPFGEVFEVISEIGLTSTGSSIFDIPFKTPIKLPQKTDIKTQVTTASNNLVIHVNFDLILIDN